MPNGPVEFSLVVPIYNEEKNIPAFLERARTVLHSISANHEIIFCMDPGTDGSEAILSRFHTDDPRIKTLIFSRRFGQPMATIAGLSDARGSVVGVIDVDLQDPPELIREMMTRLQQGFDVVYAQRRSRAGETWIKKLVAHVGYWLINRITDARIPPNTGDFRLMSRRVVNEILRLRESHGFLRGLVAIVGFKQTEVH